jgi:flagellar M-ring protein FliF
VHLVSSSVPDLSPKAVAVLDQTGTLLTQSDDHAGQGLDATQLQYVGQVESGYTKRIQELLEPVVGRENLRATVTADIDFSQSEATSEQYKPNQGDQPAAVRSQQTVDSSQGGTPTPTGIPGAASNQPPVPATAPINGASAPLQPAQTVAGTSGGGSHREQVTNYEVDRTVRVVHNGTGAIRRLNAAVIVNHRVATDAKGKVTSTPLSQEELDKLTALVQEAIGYSKERGDSVKVINAPFRADTAPKADDLPFWQQQWFLDMMRAGAVPAALALIGLAVIFGLVKPAVMAAIAKPEAELEPIGQQLDAVVDDEPDLLPGHRAFLEPPAHMHKLEAARSLAKENPTAVANIVRDWVNGDVSV